MIVKIIILIVLVCYALVCKWAYNNYKKSSSPKYPQAKKMKYSKEVERLLELDESERAISN